MLYNFCRRLARLVFFFCRWEIEGLENLPCEGPVIVASNHISNWDPILVGAALNRPVHFMAKEEIFRFPIARRFLSRCHAFPVKRHKADRQAIRKALEILGEGKLVGIFSEGSRSKTGELMKPHAGIAMLALKGQAQVVPVACIGTDRWFPCGWRKPLVIKIGEPVQYVEYYERRLSAQVLEQVSQDIMNKIQGLLSC